MMDLLIPPQEGPLIHSSEDYLFLHGSVHDTSTDYIVLASVINLALPIILLAEVVLVWY